MKGFVELRAAFALAAFFGAGALIALGGAYYIPAPSWARAALGLWAAAAFARAIVVDARLGLAIPWARARWAARIPTAMKFETDTRIVIRFVDGGEGRARTRGGFCSPSLSVLRLMPARGFGMRRMYFVAGDGADDEERRRFRAASMRAFARAGSDL